MKIRERTYTEPKPIDYTLSEIVGLLIIVAMALFMTTHIDHDYGKMAQRDMQWAQK